MKKKLYLFFLILFFVVPSSVFAKETVYFKKCVDGDTFKITVNDEVKTVRLLAVDTPESVHPKKAKEYYGTESSTYTCNLVTNAKKIELEYDDNSDKEDKYGRILAWVYVDGSLLQDLLVTNGYAEVAYLYGDYKYVSLLEDHQAVAESKEIGIWNSSERETYNSNNNIEEDPSDESEIVDDYYDESEIEEIIDDTIETIKNKNIDYKNITFNDIKYIVYVVICAIFAVFAKKMSSKKAN